MQITITIPLVDVENGDPHRGQPTPTRAIGMAGIIWTAGVSRGGSVESCRFPHLLQNSDSGVTGVEQREQYAGRGDNDPPHFAQNAEPTVFVAEQREQVGSAVIGFSWSPYYELLGNSSVLDAVVGPISVQQDMARRGRRDEALTGEAREVLEQEFVARGIELARHVIE